MVIITILLNVRTLSVVEVLCHLDYCSKFFEKSSTTYYLKLLNFGIIADCGYDSNKCHDEAMEILNAQLIAPFNRRK
jgi:hypothetical protein